MRRLVLVSAASSAVVGLSGRTLLERRGLVHAVAHVCGGINALKYEGGT